MYFSSSDSNFHIYFLSKQLTGICVQMAETHL